MKPLVDHRAANFIEKLRWILPRFGKRIMQRAISSLICWQLHRAVGQGSVEVIDCVDQSIPKGPSRCGIEIKIHRIECCVSSRAVRATLLIDVPGRKKVRVQPARS